MPLILVVLTVILALLALAVLISLFYHFVILKDKVQILLPFKIEPTLQNIMNTLVANVKEFKQYDFPFLWGANGKHQLLFSTLYRAKIPLEEMEFEREFIEDPVYNNEQPICLDWLKESKEEEDKKKPILIILPGITESSRTRYVKWFAMKLRKDFKILVFCRPGTGNSPIHTPRVFLNPRIETVVAMMDNVWNKFNKGPEKRKLFAAGFSMGGQNVVKYLGHTGKESKVSGAISITMAYNNKDTVNHFSQYPFIDNNITKTVLRIIRSNEEKMDIEKKLKEINPAIDYERIKRSKTIREIDEFYTGMVHNMKSVDKEYYDTRSISNAELLNVSVPLTIIHSYDDLFLPMHEIPRKLIQENKNIIQLYTKFGSHCAHLKGSFNVFNKNVKYFCDTTYSWCDEISFHWLNSIKNL